MRKKFQCFPDGQFYLIEELEKKLNFKFLPSNTFETKKDRLEIRKRGIEKFEKNEVSLESLEMGRKFIKKIEASYISKVSIRWVNEEVGYGLFCEEELKVGEYVGEYTGIVRKNDRRYSEPLNNYCYEYPVCDEISRSFVIDATSGHLTRFINHSFKPNLQPKHVFFDGFYHLIFIATSLINKGEQLSFNYGKNYWYIRKPPEII